MEVDQEPGLTIETKSLSKRNPIAGFKIDSPSLHRRSSRRNTAHNGIFFKFKYT